MDIYHLNTILDTIIVPCKHEGFTKVFIGENRWYPVSIHEKSKPVLKYIAAYEVKPVSAIRYYGEIEGFDKMENLNFRYIARIKEGSIKKLENPLKISNQYEAIQRSKYTSLSKLLNAKTFGDL